MNTIRNWLKFSSTKVAAPHKEPLPVSASEEPFIAQEEDEQAVDKRWLQDIYAKKVAAQAAILAEDVAQFKKRFESNAKHGKSLTLSVGKDIYRDDTIAHLKAVGFAVNPHKNLPEIFFDISLPHAPNLRDSEFADWQQWIRAVKKMHREARRALVAKQYETIKLRFEIEALRANTTIKVADSECCRETRTMLCKRLNCTITRWQDCSIIKLF